MTRIYTAPDGTPTTRERLENAVAQVEQDAYQRRLADGLAVAERICDWLNMQPPRKWAQEVREWGLAAIKKAREK